MITGGQLTPCFIEKKGQKKDGCFKNSHLFSSSSRKMEYYFFNVESTTNSSHTDLSIFTSSI
jgi:hypothetical protein